MEISFHGKRALVTGATRGIGRDIAVQLARAGAKVIAVGRDVDLLAKLKHENSEIETVALDISNWRETKEALQQFSPIDLLVNNAGVGLVKPFLEVDEGDVDKLFETNVKALMNVTQIVVADMVRRKVPGSIVNLSSQASMAGLMDHAVYCATKGAVDAFTRAVALEFGPKNIRVNAVNPTVIMTDMGRLGWADPKLSEPMKAKIPLNKFGEIEDVVNSVMFLLSDKAAMTTGHCLPVDGGFLSV